MNIYNTQNTKDWINELFSFLNFDLKFNDIFLEKNTTLLKKQKNYVEWNKFKNM